MPYERPIDLEKTWALVSAEPLQYQYHLGLTIKNGVVCSIRQEAPEQGVYSSLRVWTTPVDPAMIVYADGPDHSFTSSITSYTDVAEA